MVKISVIGACGRMGKLICSEVIQSSDTGLVGAVEVAGHPDLGKDIGNLSGNLNNGVKVKADLDELLDITDVFIDFSTGSVLDNTRRILEADRSIVIGTTGLSDDEKSNLKKICSQFKGKVVFAPNMSIGVNLLFYLTKLVAEKLSSDYEIEIIEMHHNQKKDAPSGTADKLLEIAATARDTDIDKKARYGRQGIVGPREKDEIGVHVLRGGDVVGDHTVMFAANGERIELTHKASNKTVFVRGAVEAARFLKNAQPGFYNMQDVLNIK